MNAISEKLLRLLCYTAFSINPREDTKQTSHYLSATTYAIWLINMIRNDRKSILTTIVVDGAVPSQGGCGRGWAEGVDGSRYVVPKADTLFFLPGFERK